MDTFLITSIKTHVYKWITAVWYENENTSYWIFLVFPMFALTDFIKCSVILMTSSDPLQLTAGVFLILWEGPLVLPHIFFYSFFQEADCLEAGMLMTIILWTSSWDECLLVFPPPFITKCQIVSLFSIFSSSLISQKSIVISVTMISNSGSQGNIHFFWMLWSDDI